MDSDAYKIYPLGVEALTIDFGSEISVEKNEKAVRLAAYFVENRFPGFCEVVPAYASVTVFYDVFRVRKNFPENETAFETVKNLVESALPNLGESKKTPSRVHEIAVDFSLDRALDLDFVAAHNNLTRRQVVEIFTSRTYRVFMLGFMPAFAYMGETDARIGVPRKTSPRLNVPQGSVGIAGRQTGIYPFDSPGGWQIIGRTEFPLFNPAAEKPSALEPGDLVKFYAADQ